MNLHDADFSRVLVRIFVERDYSRLVRFDEFHQTRDAMSFGTELSRLQSVACDEDEWFSHHASSLQMVLDDFPAEETPAAHCPSWRPAACSGSYPLRPRTGAC